MLMGYDVPQADGQIIQFLESRSVLLNRPYQLRIDEASVNDSKAGFCSMART